MIQSPVRKSATLFWRTLALTRPGLNCQTSEASHPAWSGSGSTRCYRAFVIRGSVTLDHLLVFLPYVFALTSWLISSVSSFQGR